MKGRNFSGKLFVEYFILPKLIILVLVTIVAALVIKKYWLFILLLLLLVLLMKAVYQYSMMQSSFIKIGNNKVIYRHKDSLLKNLGQYLNLFDCDEHNYYDYQIRSITDVTSKFSHIVIKGQIIKRCFSVYMDDDESCLDQQTYQEIKIPKVYANLKQLMVFKSY